MSALKVKLAVLASVAVVAALFIVPIAAAHTPSVNASISCTGLISFTVTGTNASGTALNNPDIGVYVDGVKVFDGAFTTANGRSFSGTYQVTDFSQATFTVSTQALGTWGDGTAGGQTDSTTVTHTSNCDSLSTNATSATIGGTIHDVATLSHAAAVTGKVTFKVFSTSDCSGTALATFSNVAASPSGGNGDGTWTFTSGNYTPSATGTFKWTATFAGDSHNSSITEGCGGTNETSTVSKATPTISTDASPLTQTITGSGLDLSDKATLAGGSSPTGTITFSLYADSSGGCGSQVGSSVTKTVSGNGSYTSPSIHVSSAGVYHWVASYGGDGNNSAVAGACKDSNENVTVTKASPTISTNAAPLSVVLVSGGLDLTDSATLAGGANPTGTITFSLYADSSGGCGSQVGSSVTKTVSGNGSYTSPSVHVSSAGLYHWVASYGGDGNNNAVAGACKDSNENVTVTKANPTISTNAAPLSVTLVGAGLDLTDTATLAGGASPTGTITFSLYCRFERGVRVAGGELGHEDGERERLLHLAVGSCQLGRPLSLGRELRRRRQQQCGCGCLQGLERERHRHQGEPDDLDECRPSVRDDRRRGSRSDGHRYASRAAPIQPGRSRSSYSRIPAGLAERRSVARSRRR